MLGSIVRHSILSVSGFILLLLLWSLAARYSHPLLLPSPFLTLESAWHLTQDGILPRSIAVSEFRILAGWAIGALVGIPLALAMSSFPIMRDLATPYLQGLRYIPPIAFVGLFAVWFGTGELSKVLLVAYTVFFIVTLNTLAGALSTSQGLIRAAKSLGASDMQTLLRVIMPATVPYIVTGLRMGLGNAFIVIAAAEMLAANSGMGFLIWSSRNLMLTDQIFMGLLVLGAMGVITDRILWAVCKRLFPHHRVV